MFHAIVIFALVYCATDLLLLLAGRAIRAIKSIIREVRRAD